MTPVIFTSGYHLDSKAIDRLYGLGATVFISTNSDDIRFRQMVGLRARRQKSQFCTQCYWSEASTSRFPTRLRSIWSSRSI